MTPAADVADFNTLKNALSVTEGTLSVHLRKHKGAGHVHHPQDSATTGP